MKSKKLFLLVVLLLTSCGAPVTSISPTSTITFTPEPTATRTPAPTPTITPSPTQIGGGAGKLIFELEKVEFSKYFPELAGELNVFTANFDGTNLTPVTNGLKGYNYIESISPDGTKLLIASTSGKYFKFDKKPILYSIDLNSLESEPIELANGLAEIPWKGSTAKWINNTQVVYIGKGEAGFGIYSIHSDGTNRNSIYINTGGVAQMPASILSVNDKRVYWNSTIETSLGGNRSESNSLTYWSSMDGSEQGTVDINGTQLKFTTYFYPPVFAPDGTKFIWIEPATATFHHNYLHVTSISGTDKSSPLDILYPFPTIRWSPDSTKILVFDESTIRSQESDSTSDVFGLFEIFISTSMKVINQHNSNVLDILVPPESRGAGSYCNVVVGDYSPDGRHMIFSLPNKNDCKPQVKSLNMETQIFTELLTDLNPLDVHWSP